MGRVSAPSYWSCEAWHAIAGKLDAAGGENRVAGEFGKIRTEIEGG